MTVHSSHVLFFSMALFLLGVIGVLTRRNAIIVLMSIELMLNAANINFIAFSRSMASLGGQVFAVFVIMLVPLQGAPLRPPVRHVAGALVLAGLLAASLVTYFWNAPPAGGSFALSVPAAGGGNIEAVGMELYRRYLLPFEIASVTLLVAMIGAVVLARKEI